MTIHACSRGSFLLFHIRCNIDIFVIFEAVLTKYSKGDHYVHLSYGGGLFPTMKEIVSPKIFQALRDSYKLSYNYGGPSVRTLVLLSQATETLGQLKRNVDWCDCVRSTEF